MTRPEAIKAMREGKKVTHKYFTREEWATQDHGLILLDDGDKCAPSAFWKDRQSKMFDNGWSLFVDHE